MKQDKIYIYGKHAVAEALMHAPKTLKKIHLAPTMDDPKLRELIRKSGVPTTTLTGSNSPRIQENATHQGIIGQLALSELMLSYEDFAKNLKPNADTSLLILGEIQDPHNVGAIIRSAAAFGVSGVLIPEHNQAPVTGAVVKVSAGMAFRVPLVSIGNVNHTVRELKDKGFWVYGLAGEGASDITKEEFDRPTLFVLGNEGTGIREKTRDLCDALVSIPMHPQCESLNVAASTAIALYAWSAQHPGALKKE